MLCLHRPEDVITDLAAAGFEATAREGYGPAGKAIHGLTVYQAWI